MTSSLAKRLTLRASFNNAAIEQDVDITDYTRSSLKRIKRECERASLAAKAHGMVRDFVKVTHRDMGDDTIRVSTSLHSIPTISVTGTAFYIGEDGLLYKVTPVAYVGNYFNESYGRYRPIYNVLKLVSYDSVKSLSRDKKYSLYLGLRNVQ